MQVQVQQAHRRRVFLVDIGQFPGQVDGKRRGPGAASHALHGKEHMILDIGGCGLDRVGTFRDMAADLGRGGCVRPDPLQRIVKRVFGQRVGHEIIGPRLQQFVQPGGADILGDQHHLDVLGFRQPDDRADKLDIGLVLIVNGDRHEFKGFAVGLVQKGLRLHETQIAPGLAQFRLNVVNQQVKCLHIARDCAGYDRCWIRL